VEALAEAIAGRPGFVLNIEAAGHAFDNHESEMFHDEAAAAAAWSKTMAFLAEHLPA
jgi:carboxymethylenebutenolidase